MKINTQAALLATIGGVLLLIVGYTGLAGVDHFFDLLASWFGPQPFLLILAGVFGGIAALGGAAVLVGAFFLFTDSVRVGRILILLGSGAGLITLVLFLARNLIKEDFSYLLAVFPATLGVAFGIAAHWRAKTVPMIK